MKQKNVCAGTKSVGKWMKIMVSMLVLVTMIFSNQTIVFAEEDPIVVEINEENFPDVTFRNHILTGSHYVAGADEDTMVEVVYDANKDGKLSKSEIENIKQLLMAEMPIVDLTGINYFTSIIELQCQRTGLKSLDVSKLVDLKYMNCYRTELEGTLDFSNNSQLEGLATQNNRNLTGINVTGCTLLDNIDFSATGVSEIDFSTNTKLRSIACADSLIEKLDLNNFKNLQLVSAYNSELKEINLDNCGALIELDCSDTKLQTLDISDCSNLQTLNISGTKIKEVDLQNNSQLTTLTVSTGTKLMNLPEHTTVKWRDTATWKVPADSFDITEFLPDADVSKITVAGGDAKLEGNIVTGYRFDEALTVSYEDTEGRNVIIMVTLVETSLEDPENDPVVVKINEDHFPDEAFRNYILTGYNDYFGEDGTARKEYFDANGNGELSKSEVEKITWLALEGEKFSNLTGIEYLTSLTKLTIERTSIKALDVSKLTKLTDLVCKNNEALTNINTEGCAELKYMDLSGCVNLKEVDLQNNKKLELIIANPNTKLQNVPEKTTVRLVPDTEDTEDESAKPEKPSVDNTPKTGDNNNLVYILLPMIVAIVMMGCVMKEKRK